LLPEDFHGGGWLCEEEEEEEEIKGVESRRRWL
jgi:hypothetical protein